MVKRGRRKTKEHKGKERPNRLQMEKKMHEDDEVHARWRG